MANNFQITQGSGTHIATEQQLDGSHEQKIRVTNFPSFPSNQTVSGIFWQALQPVSISNFPPIQSISGTVSAAQSGSWSAAITNFPSIQGVSGTVTISNFPATQAVTGAFYQATQPVSGTVAVSNLPVTQAVTGTVTVSNFPASQVVTGSVAITNTSIEVSNDLGNPVPVSNVPLSLCISATGAAAAAVTATIPALAANFHYISMIEIQAYSSAARTGTATPLVATSTNLPGSPAWTFATAGAIGTTDQKIYVPSCPVKSAASNTATTIVCPATTGVIWRINIFYYVAN